MKPETARDVGCFSKCRSNSGLAAVMPVLAFCHAMAVGLRSGQMNEVEASGKRPASKSEVPDALETVAEVLDQSPPHPGTICGAVRRQHKRLSLVEPLLLQALGTEVGTEVGHCMLGSPPINRSLTPNFFSSYPTLLHCSCQKGHVETESRSLVPATL